MNNLQLQIILRTARDVVGGRTSIETALAILITVQASFMALDPRLQSMPMFVLLAMLGIFYVVFWQLKKQSHLKVSDLKSKIIGVTNNVQLIDERTRQYNDAVVKLARQNKSLRSELKALKDLLTSIPVTEHPIDQKSKEVKDDVDIVDKRLRRQNR